MSNEKSKVLKIHDELFEFLLRYREKNKELYFLPRQNNRYGRLDQRYWFPGNDSYLLINFYSGRDNINQTGNITFGIYLRDQRERNSGTCFIHLSNTPGSNEYESKIDVVNEIINKLGMFEVDLFHRDGITPRRWNRYYASTDFLKNIESFLVDDKPAIDEVIRYFKRSEIGFLNPQISEQKINDIVNRR